MNASARYDVCVFDLDGTLTQSGIGIGRSVRYALEKMGRPTPDEDVLRRYIGPPLLESFMQIDGMDEPDARRAVEIYRERYNTVGWRENAVYPGIGTLLRALKARGVFVAVATGKSTGVASDILAGFGLDLYVDKLVGPHPDDHHADKAALIAEALPEGAVHPCMIGDRGGDVEGARALGIDGIGVLYGYGGRSELEAAGATCLAEDVSALSGLLLGDDPVNRGLFISFEGTDGSGKSTQLKKASEMLTAWGYDVTLTREPGGCPISERIREIILDVGSAGMTAECETLLYAASRAQHVAQVIRPALERGAIVLCDRFVDSSMAYQAYGRRMGEDVIARINEPATGGLEPDLTLFYDMSPEAAMSRRRSASVPDRMERENEDFVLRVYDGFQRVVRENPRRVRRVDASGTVEEVFDQTRELLRSALAVGKTKKL